MKASDYKQLKKQVEDKYTNAIATAELERLEGLAAIEKVWKMLHKPRERQNQSVEDSNSQHVSYGSLKNTVDKVLELVPETFDYKKVIMAMQKISSLKFNSSSVSNRLKRLVTEGRLEIVKQGRGKAPTIYLKNKQILEQNENKYGKELLP